MQDVNKHLSQCLRSTFPCVNFIHHRVQVEAKMAVPTQLQVHVTCACDLTRKDVLSIPASVSISAKSLALLRAHTFSVWYNLSRFPNNQPISSTCLLAVTKDLQLMVSPGRGNTVSPPKYTFKTRVTHLNLSKTKDRGRILVEQNNFNNLSLKDRGNKIKKKTQREM